MSTLLIGWAEVDITPPEPVLILGQFHARVSEGVADPLKATVLVLEGQPETAIMVSCDLCLISDELRDAVIAKVAQSSPEVPMGQLIMNATHTHTGPVIRPPGKPGSGGITWRGPGVELDVMPVEQYIEFAAERIAHAIQLAWKSRSPGAVAYGEDAAVIGRNRRVVRRDGTAVMYGNTNSPEFSHIEGYEDHSFNLLATSDVDGRLTGMVINIACPSQVSEQNYEISADFWHEARIELRKRFGPDLYVMPQCSAAGDLSHRSMYASAAGNRMLTLRNRSPREEIAHRIADAAQRIVPYLYHAFDPSAVLRSTVVHAQLPMTRLTEADAKIAQDEANQWQQRYETELATIKADSSIREQPRWYTDVTRAYGRWSWWLGVIRRYEQQEAAPTRATDLHIVRIGDVVMASNPFELYVDFGIAIKARSSAMQTFLVQLAGEGGYTPSERAFAGGGYGAVPASTPVGPEGGWEITEATLEAISSVFEDS